ncbi:hypothetical protein F5050DRAFT_1898734 [Lentinula boryana]|uniref:Exosome complex protein n=1 Tax=Lentinula boryana TaxID=40481 RepID=A0ABQ8PZZ7_9AGAR|nr:hypothetical protein F5050DRAFT_1898734 [Lentinula boryana]
MTSQDEAVDSQQICKLLDDMTASMASARETVETLKSKGPSYFENKDGISLLSLKHHVLVSYLQSFLLVSTRRALGHSLSKRDPPSEPSSSHKRSARGAGSGDLGRMRYQIEKLIKAAQQKDKVDANDTMDDPLSFRPNPQNLLDANNNDDADNTGGNGDTTTDGIYRPPRVAPMSYVPQTSAKTNRQQLHRVSETHPH